MANNYVIPDNELQEKALYDIVQYLPLDKLELKNGDSINEMIIQADRKQDLTKSAQKAVSENLPVIKKILEDRPELGEARIGNMSWQDNDGDSRPDYPVEGIQVCI